MLGELNDWCWLRGSKLSKTLCELDLSANGLNYFPSQLVKYERLVTLNLNHNKLRHLPFAIRRMQQLRTLHVSSNVLESLPAAFEDLHIDLLDVWGNCFKGFNVDAAQSLVQRTPAAYTATPLWLQAARVVSQHKVPYSSDTLPALLIDLISETPKCQCGKLCYALEAQDLLKRVTQPKFTNIKNLTYSREHEIYLDVIVCGPTCCAHQQLKAFFTIVRP